MSELSWSKNIPATAVTFEELIKVVLSHPLDKLSQECGVFNVLTRAVLQQVFKLVVSSGLAHPSFICFFNLVFGGSGGVVHNRKDYQ